MRVDAFDLDGTVLWRSDVGRGFRCAAGTDPARCSPALTRRLQALGEPDPLAAVWCWNRRALRVEHGVWAPDPTQTGSDGHPYRLLPLSDAASAFLLAVDDRKTGEQLLGLNPLATTELRLLVERLSAVDVQALQLRRQPAGASDPALRQVFGRARTPHTRTPDQHDEQGRTDLLQYHQQAIVDGQTHFDDRETTVAHTLGQPHPVLGGQTYGERLRQVLGARGWPVDGPVLEVGCGTGELAAGWGPTSSYVRVDLSPELLRTQAVAAPFSDGLLGDLCALPQAAGSVPLLICNEVLADLPAVSVGREDAATRRAREAFGIPPQAEGFYNPGSWRAIGEAARVLAPGGHALFTEFGVVDGATAEAVQLDHPEVSIHFGILVQVARQLGLHAELVRLDDLLKPDPLARWLARHSWLAVRSWARRNGIRLEARAHTPHTLSTALGAELPGLDWVPYTQAGTGPLMTRFWALLLTRP